MFSVRYVVSKLADVKSEGGQCPPYTGCWAELSQKTLDNNYGLCKLINNYPHDCLASTLGGDLSYETLSWMADQLNQAFQEGTTQAAIILKPKANA